jgi:hypothetical protein
MQAIRQVRRIDMLFLGNWQEANKGSEKLVRPDVPRPPLLRYLKRYDPDPIFFLCFRGLLSGRRFEQAGPRTGQGSEYCLLQEMFAEQVYSVS